MNKALEGGGGENLCCSKWLFFLLVILKGVRLYNCQTLVDFKEENCTGSAENSSELDLRAEIRMCPKH